MFTKEIATLTSFLAEADRNFEELCQFLVLNTFRDLSPRSIYVGHVIPSGHIQLTSTFGFKQEQVDSWQLIPLSLRIPLTEAISTNQCVIIETVKEFFTRYSDLEQIEGVDEDWVGCIAIPMKSFGAYFLVLNQSPSGGHELEVFLRTVGHILIMHARSMQKPKNQHQNSEERKLERLTMRQELICDLLIRGFTNLEIANEIGFSESLVRQETIAIYSTLHVSGRKELIKKTSP